MNNNVQITTLIVCVKAHIETPSFKIALYKGELQDLQKLVKKMIAYKESDEDVENIKEDLLYSSNQLDKSKNARRYKKDKHSKAKYEEWD